MRVQLSEQYANSNPSTTLLLGGTIGAMRCAAHESPGMGRHSSPDLTVVTPCFFEDRISFCLASRGHHTDIGGKGVTSMTPESKELWEEGISVPTLKIASRGVFLEDRIRAAFETTGQFPGCAPTRRIQNNISDLKAQISANRRGLVPLNRLHEELGLPLVHQAIIGIQADAELAVRKFSKTLAKQHSEPLTAVDFYDGGTPIKLKIEIDASTSSATFEFEGTGAQVSGNFKSPSSREESAIPQEK